MKKWHTNKTQPNFKQYHCDSIIIIWKNKDITDELIRQYMQTALKDTLKREQDKKAR